MARLIINGNLYEFRPLGYDDAILVAAELGGAVLPSLGSIMDGPLGAFMEGNASLEDLLGSDVGFVFQNLKPSEVGRVMGESLRRGDLKPSMLRRALKTTTRAGVLLEGEAFDEAFRGNVAESLLAAFHALSANGLFTLPSTSEPLAEVEGVSAH